MSCKRTFKLVLSLTNARISLFLPNERILTHADVSLRGRNCIAWCIKGRQILIETISLIDIKIEAKSEQEDKKINKN